MDRSGAVYPGKSESDSNGRMYTMDFNELYERARRIVISTACFIVAAYLVYRGQTVDPTQFSTIVPVMLVLTALTVAATGLVLVLRTNQEVES